MLLNPGNKPEYSSQLSQLSSQRNIVSSVNRPTSWATNVSASPHRPTLGGGMPGPFSMGDSRKTRCKMFENDVVDAMQLPVDSESQCREGQDECSRQGRTAIFAIRTPKIKGNPYALF
jgi:hypothetical protein